MFLAAIVKEHAASAATAEPKPGAISHDEAMTVEVTGVVAVPEDFLGAPPVSRDRREPRRVPASRSRWV